MCSGFKFKRSREQGREISDRPAVCGCPASAPAVCGRALFARLSRFASWRPAQLHSRFPHCKMAARRLTSSFGVLCYYQRREFVFPGVKDMAYIIAEPCIGTKDTACVDACPVDCIHPKKDEAGFRSEERRVGKECRS